jgi:hypothetical protein
MPQSNHRVTYSQHYSQQKLKASFSLKLFAVLALIYSGLVGAAIKMKPTPLVGIDYKKPLLSGEYDSSIPTPESIIGFPVGKKTATPKQIVDAITAWSKTSNKIKLIEYAKSHEGRPLYYAIISTPEILANIDTIQSQLAQLANPKNLSSSEEKQIIDNLPAVAWMAYSIHGNESSGADAALAAIYHLIASKQADVIELLSKSVIIIDPSMNPDGRARFTKALEQNRGVAPNIDDQSLLHAGTWPYGRTNHYLFDLNRDFILGVHPETIGRVKAINQWHPQLMIDGHEMGAQTSYLFAPAREPVNKNLAEHSKKWGNVFANDQAGAFDKKNWPYFTGEWFENLYPGYSSYAEFRGSVHILYEQARIAEDGVRQGNDRILTYQEAVHHQLVSTIANLKTLAKHSKAIYKDFVTDKRKVISSSSPYANQTFAILPSKNLKRLQGFVALMQLQGFEIEQTTKAMRFADAKNQLGDKVSVELPIGTVLIRNRQPLARLIAAILEFDTEIIDSVLVEERQKVLRDGSSLMYDTTAWNLTMMHGVEAYVIPTNISSNTKTYSSELLIEKPEKQQAVSASQNIIAYTTDGENDAAVGFAAQLMEQGIIVRILDKATVLGDVKMSRGSIVINRYDNEFYADDLKAVVDATAEKMKVKIHPIAAGLGDADLPDIGGKHFRLLKQPKVALLTGSGINFYDYGAIWHSIDSNLGIRHSHLDVSRFNYTDLRRYNTLVIPDRFYGQLQSSAMRSVEDWVKDGGTLIVIDGSISSFTNTEAKFSRVKQIADSFGDIENYNLALQTEWLSQQDSFDALEQSKSHNAIETIEYPWADTKALNAKALERENAWQARFKPSGAIVAARVDQQHWLTFGSPKYIPILVSNNPVLMADETVDAPVRIGHYQKMDKSVWAKMVASFKDKPVERKVAWSSLPDGYELKMRMSGLLWPEANQRIANSAFLTRERKGNGQVILFAAQPVFRGSTMATNRLLLNAIVYGAGLGTNQPIQNL